MQILRQFNRLFLGKLVLSGSNFLILWLLSNYLPASFTGEYYFQLSILSTISIVLGFGADNSLFFFIKKNMIALPNLFSLAFQLFALLLLAWGVVLASVKMDLITDGWYFFFTAAYIFTLLLQTMFNAWFFVNKAGWTMQAVNTMINIVFIGFLLTNRFYRDGSDNIWILYTYYSISFICTAVVAARLFLQNGRRVAATGRRRLRRFFLFGARTYLGNCIFFLGANLDLFLIRYFINPKLTVYVQAVKLVQMICAISYLLFYPFMGKIIGLNYEDGIDTLLRTGRVLIFLLIVFLIPFYTACYFLLHWIFPVDTDEVFQLLLLLSVAIIATSVAYIYTSYFVATKKYRQNTWSAVIFFITMGVLCIVLIPKVGVFGGAISYSLAILFSLIFDITFVIRSARRRFADAIMIRRSDLQLIKSIF